MTKNSACKLSSAFKSVRMLPNRADRSAITAEIHGCSRRSALAFHVPVKRPSIHCEVIAQPAVLSHRRSAVTTSHTADSSAAHTHKTHALQSLSDSNVLAKKRTAVRMNRSKAEPVNSDAKLHSNTVDACLFTESHRPTVSHKNENGILLCDESFYRRRKCLSVTKVDDGGANCHVAILEHGNISGSSSHVSAVAVGHIYTQNDCQGDRRLSSTTTSLCGRLINDGHNHSRTKFQTRPLDCGFLGRVQSVEDEEFLENLRKASRRLRTVRTGADYSRVRQRKSASTIVAKVCTGGLCVVGQTYLTRRETTVSTAGDLQSKNTSIGQATGRDYCNEVGGTSLPSNQLAHTHRRLRGVVSNVSGNSGHHYTSAVVAGARHAGADSDKENLHHVSAAPFHTHRPHLTLHFSTG